MKIKEITFLLVALFFIHFVSAQEKMITFSGEIKSPGLSKDDIYHAVNQWFDGQTAFRDLRNARKDTVTGKGHFPYRNHTEFMKSADLTRDYALKSNGMFTFSIVFVIKDGGYEYVISEFKHWPTEKSDTFHFGIITEDAVPDTSKCSVDNEYCTKVWTDMKGQIKTRTQLIIGTLPLQKN